MHFDWQQFQKTLCAGLDIDLQIDSVESVSGGDISPAFRLETDKIDLFVKLNNPEREKMFRLEWAGLIELASSGSARIPEPISVGVDQNASYFVMEYIDMEEGIDQVAAGKAVAALHQVEHTRYGWDQNNFIGSNVQHNEWHSDWAEFFWNCRIEPQIVRAIESGFSILEKALDPLRDKTLSVLERHSIAPSLLHGDLWHGNVSTSSEKETVLYDPAVYWGDPEADIAATRLFGGFSEEFYSAYYAVIPMQEGAEQREHLYQLYHWLNHLNMAGQGYLEQCLNCIADLYSV